MIGGEFHMHHLDRQEGVVFRQWDRDRTSATFVVIALSVWESWDRPVTIGATIVPIHPEYASVDAKIGTGT